MKTKLLTSLLFISIISYSQKNGWHQCHKSGESFAIDSDINSNIHLGTDTGYLVYNTFSNTVVNHANLTSQNLSIGKIRGVKCNPANSEIVLLNHNGSSIIIYDGNSAYTEYNSENSDFGGNGMTNFIPKELSYSNQGTLYLYDSDDSQYQTFENGTFSAIQTIGFEPNDIVENIDGTKTYFASFTGLWELDKGTGTYTNFTASNSDVHTDFIYKLHTDVNGLLYIGGVDGISTYDEGTGDFDLVYQETWPVNPAVIYDVEEMDVFSDGKFLVKTQPLGWATLDLDTDQYTHYTNDELCNPRNVKVVNDEIYVQPAFGELTLFDQATTTCTELDTNHLNVGDIGLFGALGIAIRPTPNDANKIDVLWTNNAICGPTQTCSMYSLTLPLDFSGGPFDDAHAEISVSDAGLNQIAVLDINNQPAVLVGETNGYRILQQNGTEHNIPHGINGYRPFQNEFVVQGQNSDNPPATPKIAVLSGGFDSNNEYTNYIANINTDDNTLSDLSEILFSNPSTSNTGTAGLQIDPDRVKFFMALAGIDANRYTARVTWNYVTQDFEVDLEENVSAKSEFRPEPFFLGDGTERFQSSPNLEICSYNAITGEFVCNNADIDNDGINDRFWKPGVYLESDTSGQFPADNFFGGSFPETDNTKKLNMMSATETSGSNSRRNNEFDFEIIPEISIDNLPSDFFVLNSFIYVYSETHLAAALSTTYGLLVNTAIDYSSLTLNTDDVVLNEKNVLIYPNPANDVVSFSDKSITKADLFDINGRKVLEVTDNSFSIKNLSKGVYFIKATTNNGSIESGKLIKN
ncbi:MAG: T9SS type A sorting domain-containing protein [Bacteroidota bacterium]